MIKIIQERDNIYTVQFDIVDMHALLKISTGFKITSNDALTSCINRGIEHYSDMLKEIADIHNKRVELPDEGMGDDEES